MYTYSEKCLQMDNILTAYQLKMISFLEAQQRLKDLSTFYYLNPETHNYKLN